MLVITMQNMKQTFITLWSLITITSVTLEIINYRPTQSAFCRFTCLDGRNGAKLRVFACCLKDVLPNMTETGHLLEAYAPNSCPTGSVACVISCYFCSSSQITSYNRTNLRLLNNDYLPSAGKHFKLPHVIHIDVVQITS